MASLRIGVIGARRREQGIGEFVARDLARCGADVAAIAGTTQETVLAARENLQQRYGLNARGYLSVEAMLAAEALDAVAICSPQQLHRRHLEQVLERRAHVLCEKPLVWEAARDPAADAQRIAAEFAARERLLMVNEPWPFTLAAFDRCWPSVRAPGRTPQRLAMLLCPPDLGDAMLPNALPHVLSLLLALAPGGGRVEEISFARPHDAAREVKFSYVHHAGRTEVAARLVRCERQPRPAGYAIDGCGVRRVIHMPDYRMSFEATALEREEEFWRFVESGEGSPLRVPLEDPLTLLAGDFVLRVQSVGEGTFHARDVAEGSRLLADIYFGERNGRSARHA